jgi:hypothetical protein
MSHVRYLLPKGLNLARRSAALEPFPSGQELGLMNLRPCFDEPPLPLPQAASDELNGIDGEDPDFVLVVCVEVRSVVWCRRLSKHPDDDPEEPRDLWHPGWLLVSPFTIIATILSPRHVPPVVRVSS